MLIIFEIYANVRVTLGNNTGSDKGKRRRKYRLGESRKLVLRTKTGNFPLEKSVTARMFEEDIIINWRRREGGREGVISGRMFHSFTSIHFC